MVSFTTRVPILDVYHVTPSTIKGAGFLGHFAFDTSKSLVGPAENNSWCSMIRELKMQRVNVDLGWPYVIRRMLYVNYHDNGRAINEGANYVRLYGSNSNIMNDPYDRCDSLTLLWEGEFEICTFEPVPPFVFPQQPIYNPIIKGLDINNSDAYRFHALDIWNDWEGNAGIGFRRIELQTEDGYSK